MKRPTILLFLIIIFFSCSGNDHGAGNLQARIDSLKEELANSYKPGLGEFMSDILVHHSKLWFAGKNKNWPLATFELQEINESITDIKTYDQDRKEIKYLYILNESLDSLKQAIKDKSETHFEQAFHGLTVRCNECHTVNNYAFNVIRVPESPPFSNQDFSGK